MAHQVEMSSMPMISLLYSSTGLRRIEPRGCSGSPQHRISLPLYNVATLPSLLIKMLRVLSPNIQSPYLLGQGDRWVNKIDLVSAFIYLCSLL